MHCSDGAFDCASPVMVSSWCLWPIATLPTRVKCLATALAQQSFGDRVPWVWASAEDQRLIVRHQGVVTTGGHAFFAPCIRASIFLGVRQWIRAFRLLSHRSASEG